MSLISGTVGFPRIGSTRQMKIALERFWKGNCTEAELLQISSQVDEEAWMAQKNAGIDLIGLDGTLYDQVLDAIYMLGLAPARFQGLSGLELYFAMARGAMGAPALDMSKFFDTNYHYLVPEFEEGFEVKPSFDMILDKLSRGQELLGKEKAIPLVIGPVTLVLLSKAPANSGHVVDKLLPAYIELLKALAQNGAPEIQLHEPALVTDKGASARELFEAAYSQLSTAGCPLHLVTYYDDLGSAYEWAVQLPVAAISMDFVGVPGSAAGNDTMELVRKYGFPSNKRLGAGIVDGRSVWADDLAHASAWLTELKSLAVTSLCVQSSVPLFHLPWDMRREEHLPDNLKQQLAFALQKLDMVKQLAAGKLTGADSAGVKVVDDPPMDIALSLFSRSQSYAERRQQQLQFPPFPTTSIGSFPQTSEVRRLRLQLRKGQLTQDQYEALVDQQIAYAIGVQDALGIDVLVHGEPERTDMVEYFGAALEGMFFTVHGWVQSYGSRYVRPPIIVGDIAFKVPMTVREYKVAQALTQKPVKGMLTGPVTILNWSFPRKDISRRAQALQLALALRQEVAALQDAGCKIIQVDDPALREGLPLKSERFAGYLSWAVQAFRLATSVALPQTQVVTHLCYSDFEDIMEAVKEMDADILTIENSRSGDAMIRSLAAAGFNHDLGAGVYDVHSPLVPEAEAMVKKMDMFLATGILKGHPDRMWFNPDCGLKTRQWQEVVPSLRNMVAAAVHMRQKMGWTPELKPGAVQPAGHGPCCC